MKFRCVILYPVQWLWEEGFLHRTTAESRQLLDFGSHAVNKLSRDGITGVNFNSETETNQKEIKLGRSQSSSEQEQLIYKQKRSAGREN